MHSTAEMSAGLRRRVLTLLFLAYVLNFVDRNIIGILAVPIRKEFGLSDTALGGLGVAFGVLYAIVAIPIARLADRRSRVRTIGASIALWSLFTALCGAAQSYAQLAIARIGVAVGEAGGIAPSYSLIADYFPRDRRSRALAIFSLGIPVGSALGIMFGGWVAVTFDWRTAFLAAGIAGIPVAALIAGLVPEPVRGAFDRPAPPGVPTMSEAARRLTRIPSFWLLSLGAALGSIPGYGLIFWLPSLFHRSFGLSLGEASSFYGSVILVGGVAGIWLGGWLGDRTGPSRPAAYALIPALCFLLAVPLFVGGLFAPSLAAAWCLFALAQMLTLSWLGPVVTAVQHIVVPQVRATASASFLFINNIVGISGGIYLLGWVSDLLKAAHGADSLRYSILYVLGFYLVSAVVYLIASTRLRRDITQAETAEI
jgi:MFS family permease